MANSVLVIEDEPSIADNITYALSTEGYRPVWSPTGGEALEVLRSKVIDLIILDIKMPKIMGTDLLKTIKRKNVTIPIIMITGYPSVKNTVDSMRFGALNVFPKPLDIPTLLAETAALTGWLGDGADECVYLLSLQNHLAQMPG